MKDDDFKLLRGFDDRRSKVQTLLRQTFLSFDDLVRVRADFGIRQDKTLCVCFSECFQARGVQLKSTGGSWQEKDNSNRNPIHGNIFGRVSFPSCNIFVDDYGTVF